MCSLQLRGLVRQPRLIAEASLRRASGLRHVARGAAAVGCTRGRFDPSTAAQRVLVPSDPRAGAVPQNMEAEHAQAGRRWGADRKALEIGQGNVSLRTFGSGSTIKAVHIRAESDTSDRIPDMLGLAKRRGDRSWLMGWTVNNRGSGWRMPFRR